LYQTISPETLKALQQIDCPSICNAIEGFNVQPKNQGFMLPEIRAIFQEFPPVIGYAVLELSAPTSPKGATSQEKNGGT
jgi:4-hydroxy-4-methyl-2-oxoglutarate aldolase